MAACRDDLESWALDDLVSLCAPPRESSWLEKAKAIPDGAWITGHRELLTGKILPSPNGHSFSGHIKPVGRLDDGPEGQYYFDPSKQLPTLRKTSWQEGDEALLLAQERKVRRTQPIEIWRLKGLHPGVAGRTGGGPHPRRAGNLGNQDPISGNRLGGRSLVCLNPP